MGKLTGVPGIHSKIIGLPPLAFASTAKSKSKPTSPSYTNFGSLPRVPERVPSRLYPHCSSGEATSYGLRIFPIATCFGCVKFALQLHLVLFPSVCPQFGIILMYPAQEGRFHLFHSVVATLEGYREPLLVSRASPLPHSGKWSGECVVQLLHNGKTSHVIRLTKPRTKPRTLRHVARDEIYQAPSTQCEKSWGVEPGNEATERAREGVPRAKTGS